MTDSVPFTTLILGNVAHMEHLNPRVEPIRDPEKLAAIKKLLKEEAPARDYLLFVLGMNTALRIGDLLSLRVGDVIDPRGRARPTVLVQRSASEKGTRVRLNAAATEALRHYISQVGVGNRDAVLFCSRNSPRPLNRTQVWRLINGWCHKVGLTDSHYGAHTLRKTWGYMALRYHSIPLGVIQAKFHHSAPGITRRYLGVAGEKIENVETLVNL